VAVDVVGSVSIRKTVFCHTLGKQRLQWDSTSLVCGCYEWVPDFCEVCKLQIT